MIPAYKKFPNEIYGEKTPLPSGTYCCFPPPTYAPNSYNNSKIRSCCRVNVHQSGIVCLRLRDSPSCEDFPAAGARAHSAWK